jgi:membrane-associated protease RseP (regulator of RpoE activity)
VNHVTIRRIFLFCMLAGLIGGAAALGALAGGTAVYLAADNQLKGARAPSPAANMAVTSQAAAATATGPATAVATAIAPATRAATVVEAASANPTAQPAVVTALDQSTAVEQAVARVGPAVITVINDLGQGQQASGSGVIISPEWGVYVTAVGPGSPGAQAGLHRGDIITQIGDVSLDRQHPFVNALLSHAVGDTVNLKVARGDQILSLKVTLAAQPVSP